MTASLDEVLAATERTNELLAELLAATKVGQQLLLNQAETAEALGVGEKTIAQRRAEGTMRESSLFPGRVLFSKAYLARLLAEHDGDASPALRRAS